MWGERGNSGGHSLTLRNDRHHPIVGFHSWCQGLPLTMCWITPTWRLLPISLQKTFDHKINWRKSSVSRYQVIHCGLLWVTCSSSAKFHRRKVTLGHGCVPDTESHSDCSMDFKHKWKVGLKSTLDMYVGEGWPMVAHIYYLPKAFCILFSQSIHTNLQTRGPLF